MHQAISWQTVAPRIKDLRETVYLLNRNKLTKAAILIIYALIFIAIFSPWLAPHPTHIMLDTNPQDKLLPPSTEYWFGTDELGRDIFSRVLYGTRISLQTGLLAVGISLLIGIPLGAIAGASEWYVDESIMRITDIFLSFPGLLMAIAIAAILGPSLQNAIFAISISWWPWYTRIVRGQAISLKERQFVKAAQAIGTPHLKIIFKHIIPNCVAPVIVQASMDIGGVILTIAALSFLGLGAQPPTPEWGLMIATSRTYFLSAWWYSFFPGMAILVTVLVFNLLGDGLREVLDPKTRKK
ncbi:MAG: ABC transporter permease [Deltaproteobacteria bacterium]|nr:ABC transporter permease [Deltaproteobacteria bacterium]